MQTKTLIEFFSIYCKVIKLGYRIVHIVFYFKETSNKKFIYLNVKTNGQGRCYAYVYVSKVHSWKDSQETAERNKVQKRKRISFFSVNPHVLLSQTHVLSSSKLKKKYSVNLNFLWLSSRG